MVHAEVGRLGQPLEELHRTDVAVFIQVFGDRKVAAQSGGRVGPGPARRRVAQPERKQSPQRPRSPSHEAPRGVLDGELASIASLSQLLDLGEGPRGEVFGCLSPRQVLEQLPRLFQRLDFTARRRTMGQLG